jgi:hypothetical protein
MCLKNSSLDIRAVKTAKIKDEANLALVTSSRFFGTASKGQRQKNTGEPAPAFRLPKQLCFPQSHWIEAANSGQPKKVVSAT